MKRLRKTIGIIGCGNMGSAILSGLLKNRIARSNHLFVYDSVRSKRIALASRFKARVAKSNEDLMGQVDIVLLAVKPQDLKSVAHEMRKGLRLGQTVISILAGTPVAKLRRAFGNKVAMVRAMPNLGIQVGEGMTALTGSARSALAHAEAIFLGCGKVIRLSEKYFDLVTAVSGSGPAYFLLLMELLATAAHRGGISKEAAELLAIQTAFGTGKLAAVSPHSPGELRKRVTSKKGTTEAALHYLEKKRFSNLFLRAVEQAVRRSRELSAI
ncbi:MAG: pyrroline-5-carboxylate reductase [Candidatus Omnitrophica bacterium]|nr:pyrroline-5-carboxylate reductase [Candidatus Omnitrophota bacterium]